ncbi:MAG: type 4a pilus biogenesis protein PilO [Candidatus Eiseniibacteriota bacterium]|nr:MAG: type 4a pilus biogenesis protein PilO [Candidatus Eisenbacteria bacterium]
MDLKDPKNQQMLIVGIVMAAVLYFYFFAPFIPFGFRAQLTKYGFLSAQYHKLTLDLAKARQMVNDLPKLQREYEELHAAWLLAKQLLPEEKEVASLLSKVTIAGQQSGVKFALFKPNPPVDEGHYVRHPVEVSVTGGFHEVGTFMSEVANLSRIVNVSRLSLVSLDDKPPDESVQANFIASAYTLKRSAQND